MKECLICGDKVNEGAMHCSNGHSLFRHPRSTSYTVDTKLIEEILRQIFVSSTEDEIIYLLDETTRILSRDRTPVTREKVEILGNNLKQDLEGRKRRQQEEAERNHRAQEEAERKRKEKEEEERKRREHEKAERQRWQQQETERRRREQVQAELRRGQLEQVERRRREREEEERRHTEQEQAKLRRRQQEEAERRRREREQAEHQLRQQVEQVIRLKHFYATEDEIRYLVNETISILNWRHLPATWENVETVGSNLIQNLVDRKEQERIERWRRQVARSRHTQKGENRDKTALSVAELHPYHANKFLFEHFKYVNLQNPGTTTSEVPDLQIRSNQDFWVKVLEGQRVALRRVDLIDFQIVDWFPRAPGLFHTSHAREARSSAEQYIKEENGIIFYTPRGKMHMIEGGTGSVRFKPLKIDGEDCWLCTATKDSYCHSGIPLAIPNYIMQEIDTNSRLPYKIKGQVKFLPQFLSDIHFSHMSRIPQLYVLVSEIILLSRTELSLPVKITPMVLFKRDEESETRHSGRRQGENVTYVVCRADNPFELDRAIDWLTWYAERYKGEVITNFDEQRPAFCNAPFSLQNVMSGNIDSYQMQELRIEHADIVCNTIKSIHSEETNVTQIDIKLGNGVTIHGDFVVANSIKESFNKASLNESGELKNLLEELSVAVAEMSEHMQKEDAIRVARALTTVVDEASSSRPNRQWWQVSVDGLKEAAKNVGNIGKPVLEILQKLVPVLMTMS
jgi:hypothetical protein